MVCLEGKEYAGNAEDLDLIFGLRRSPGKGTATHSSFSAWRTPMDRVDIYSPEKVYKAGEQENKDG